jgi:hypothetical protein
MARTDLRLFEPHPSRLVTSFTTKALRACVRHRHAGPGWAVFDEVRSETGYTVGTAIRTADMLAFSLWRSRGFELHGFELKVSRGDWLRELGQPEKAEAVARYVDHWWLVVPPDLIEIQEVPAWWGVLVVHGPAASTVARKAPKLEAQPLDRPFIASIIRKVARGQFTANASAFPEGDL